MRPPPMPPMISFLMQACLLSLSSRAFELLAKSMDRWLSLSDFLSVSSRSLMLLTILLTLPFMMSYSSMTLLLRWSTRVLALTTRICSASFIRMRSSVILEDSNSMPLAMRELAVGRELPSRSTK